jgi:hypothetical protein
MRSSALAPGWDGWELAATSRGRVLMLWMPEVEMAISFVDEDANQG